VSVCVCARGREGEREREDVCVCDREKESLSYVEEQHGAWHGAPRARAPVRVQQSRRWRRRGPHRLQDEDEQPARSRQVLTSEMNNLEIRDTEIRDTVDNLFEIRIKRRRKRKKIQEDEEEEKDRIKKSRLS
jgi:hypothetical protein